MKEYRGKYIVRPDAFKKQILPTKETLTIEDIRVRQIDRYDTSNASGGTTVYIAEGVSEHGN